MTEPQGEKSQRRSVLGDEPVTVPLKLPKEIHEALAAWAGNEYESVQNMARRAIVRALRDQGLLL